MRLLIGSALGVYLSILQSQNRYASSFFDSAPLLTIDVEVVCFVYDNVRAQSI